MSPERLAWESLSRIGLDAGALGVAWITAVGVRELLGSLGLAPFDAAAHVLLLALVAPVVLVVLAMRGDFRPSRPVSLQPLGLLSSVVLGLGAIALALFLLDVEWVSRPVLVSFGGLGVVALVVMRRMREAVRGLGRLERVIVCAPSEAGVGFVEQVAAHPAWGLQVVAHLQPERLPADATALRDVLVGAGAGQVVVVGDAPDQRVLTRLAAACDELGLRLSLDASFLGVRFGSAELRDFGAYGLVSFGRDRPGGVELAFKRAIDVVGAAAGLALLSPVMVALAVAIRLTDGGPALYAQRRIGLHGRPFTLYKLRSMRQGAHAERAALDPANEVEGLAFKMRRDPRVTAVGYWLRRSSLDEVPQLFNVLRGDMSLVGPRPPLPEEVERYEPWQRRRLSMRPGVTGLWQVSGRSDLPFHRWMQLDLAYIDRWSVWLDLVVIARTVPAVLSGRGAW